MINILIISDNDKIQTLINHFQPLLLGKIELVDNFELGLNIVFIKKPAIIFVQRDLSGVSGETVSSHIKTLLGDKSPNIILLTENLPGNISSETFSKSSINLFLPEDQLIESFRLHLNNFPGMTWKESLQIKTETNSTVKEKKVPLPPEKPAIAPIINTNKQRKSSEPSSSVKKKEVFPTITTEITSKKPASPCTAAHRREEKDVPTQAALKKAAINSNTNKNTLPADTRKFSEVVQEDTSSLPFELGMFDNDKQSLNLRRSKSKKQWIYFLSLFIAVGIIMLISFNYSRFILVFQQRQPALSAKAMINTPPIATGQDQTASSDQTINSIRLPSFIPIQSIDQKYSDMHPGWVRHYDQHREYLIFREKDAIKAVQVIALKEGGINDDFLSSAFKELGNNKVLKVTARREKNGYSVEEGEFGVNLDFILYKKLNTGMISAFIVALPPNDQ